MATTFTNLQTRVQNRLIDVPTAVQSEIPTLIVEAVHAIEDVHNFQVMKAEAQYITDISASNSHIIGQIPSDWKEPRENSYYVLQQGGVQELVWQPTRMFAYRDYDPFDVNDKGQPRSLLIGEAQNDTVPDPDNPDQNMIGLNIEVYPYPDGLSDWTTAPAGEYRIRIPYWRYLPDLSGGTDQNWFTNHATEFIIDHATARGFMMDWDEKRAMFWWAQAWGPRFDGVNQVLIGGQARKAINLDKSINFAPGRVLPIRLDVFGSTNEWR